MLKHAEDATIVAVDVVLVALVPPIEPEIKNNIDRQPCIPVRFRSEPRYSQWIWRRPGVLSDS